jgi:hypothetical protein
MVRTSLLTDSTDWLKSYTGAAVILIGIALLQVVVPVVFVVIDGRPLQANTRNVWLPMAETVFNGGSLYLDQWDNKPPLFHFLNLIVYSTDAYVPTFFLLIGLANGVTAVLLWLFCQRFDQKTTGLIAAIIFLGTLPIVNGLQIDPRQFANVALFVALLTPGAVVSGVAIAVAGLFTQFAVLGIPVILTIAYLRDRLTIRWLVTFGFAGVAVVGLSFGVVSLVWSPSAAEAGFRSSFLSLSQYVGGYVERDIGLFGNPIGWGFYQYDLLVTNVFWVLLVVLGLTTLVDPVSRHRRQLVLISFIATVLLMLPRAIRSGNVYLMLPLPFISILAAFGLERLPTILAKFGHR